MLKIKADMKDWQVAQHMFGKNTSAECKIVKALRKHGSVSGLCEGWCVISHGDDCGWLIPNECLTTE